MTGGIAIRRLGPDDLRLLDDIGPELFDQPVDPALAREFLGDARHHLFAALNEDRVVGFVSGVHYVHPDKRGQMFINEVSVTPSHRRRGIARSLLDRLVAHARALGCAEAWVLTERSNRAALSLYESRGDKGDTAVMFTFALD